MKEFNWKEFLNRNNKIAVHCNTEEEAKDFCKQMDEHGMTWSLVGNYLNDTRWGEYGSLTCYSNHGTWGRYVTYQELGYTILEWSDYMEKPFTKADLKVGDIVKIQNGVYCIVLPNDLSDDGLGLFSECINGSIHLDTYHTDLTNDIDWRTIIAVYKTSEPNKDAITKVKAILTDDNKTRVEAEMKNTDWDWERKEEEPIKELTMEELEKHFGCKVKIVAEQ